MIALFISFALNFERAELDDKLTVWGCIESMEQKGTSVNKVLCKIIQPFFYRKSRKGEGG